MRQEIPALATRRRAHPARTVHSMVDDELRVSTHKSIIKTLGRQYTDAAQFFVELVVNSWMWGEATKVEIRIPESGSTIEYEEWGNGMDLTGLRESLTKKPDPVAVRRALLARANVLALRGYGPFEVSVNGEHVKPEELRGSTMLPVNIATEYGRITGEIMIMPISKVRAGISEAGISVQQKHITCLQHQFFGLDQYRTHGLSRIQGWVNADFLRRLPGGNDFEHDSRQWRVFEKALRGFVRNKVYKSLRQSASRRELRSIQYLNHEIAERLRRSFKRNIQMLSKAMVKAKTVPKINAVPGKTRKEIVLGERKRRRGKKHDREATRSVIHLKDQILAFDVAHGGDRGQAYVETDKSGVRTVYVNMDHPMWDVESNLTPTKL